jgi:hypothetical protein
LVADLGAADYAGGFEILADLGGVEAECGADVAAGDDLATAFPEGAEEVVVRR